MQNSNYAILDNLLEGCQIIDSDWRYVYVNEVVARQGRSTREALLGQTMQAMYPGIETTDMFALLRRCMSEREPGEMENEFTYPDGSQSWFQLRFEPVPEGVFILSIDISDRKRDELRIRQQLNRLRALRAIDLAILGSTALRLSMKTILKETTDQLQVDAAVVMLLNPTSNMLNVVADRGFQSRAIENFRLRLGEGLAGLAALERKTVSVPDIAASPDSNRVLPIFHEEGFRSAFAIPLIAKGTLVGVLTILNRTPLDPPSDWLEFMEALAGQTAMALDSLKSFDDLQRSNLELTMAYANTIEGWSRALDLRDKETEGHSLRVTELTMKLAAARGLSEAELTHIHYGALLHDIGKMGIPDAILLKPDKLTDEEWVIMRKHPALAYELLLPIAHLRPALDIPYCHHERWDGTGYPRGLKGEGIPLAARLFAVVDVWDALRSDRPYRKGWSEEKIIEHIKAGSGTHFDPKVVELFLKVRGEDTK